MKALIVGTGRMGQMLASVLEANGDEVLALTDCLHADEATDAFDQADVIIDFSHRDNLNWYLPIALEKHIPIVLGTTALEPEDLSRLSEASTTLPVFHASNYSLGIAVLKRLAKLTASLLKEEWDMEIVETHHNQKADAPSGTALTLLEAIDPENEFEHVFGRQGNCGARKKEIGIHAIRGGTVAGDHTIDFFGNDEILSLSHHAGSRQIFAQGALNAAHWLLDQPEGLYGMEEMIDEKMKGIQ